MKNFLYIFTIFAFAMASVACSDKPIDDTVTPGNQDGNGNGGQADQIVSERPGPNFKSVYQKHVSLWEFTGAWCANCPGGYTNMNFILSTNPDFTDIVHPMAFHSNASDTDDLAIKETDQIMQDKNLTSLGFPSYLVDMAYGGSLVEGVNLTAHLYDTLEENPCFCGVAVASAINGNEADVTVKLTSELNATWRVSVYVVEDKVKYYQKDGMKEHDQYTHRHVVRKIVSASYRGDRIGGQITPVGEEVTSEYKIAVDPVWNLDNTYIYVLALDTQGVVNNMNFCQINGGYADYNRI